MCWSQLRSPDITKTGYLARAGVHSSASRKKNIEDKMLKRQCASWRRGEKASEMAINPQPLVNSGLFKHVLESYNLKKNLPQGTWDFSFKMYFSLEAKKKCFFKHRRQMKVLSDYLTSQSECSRLEFCLILANITSSLQTRKEIQRLLKLLIFSTVL